MRGSVDRYVEIAVSYYDRKGIQQSFDVRGYSACTWQHEYDHLEGILFPHRVTNPQSYCSWAVFKEYHQADFAEEVNKLVEKWGT
jgi:peptide deformylase